MKNLVLLLALSIFSIPAPAADVSGVWDLEMIFSEDTRSTGVCTFTQKDQKLTGSCHEIAISGDVYDHKVTWGFEAEQNGRKHSMTFIGALDPAGTTIKGTCKVVPGQEGTFTAKKQEHGRQE